MTGVSPLGALAAAALLAAGPGCAALRAGSGLEAQPLSARRAWVSPLHREHPLVGRVWQVRDGRFIDEGQLQADLAQADFVLLGEQHDNPDHHLLQARLVRALASTGRQPALAFEMLATNRQASLDASLIGKPSADDVAEAVGWASGGWPDFAIYRPLFAAGIQAGLPLLAADLPRKQIQRYFQVGDGAFAPRVRELLVRAGGLPEAMERAVGDEMRRSHCGQLAESAVKELVQLQQARDAQLAERLLSADRELASPGYEQGAVLIAGLNHVRNDRGVPTYLAREAPGRASLAVGFLEVSPDRLEPADYAARLGSERLPFDYVVFTPAAARRDPCEGLRQRAPQRPSPPSPAPPAPILTVRAG